MQLVVLAAGHGTRFAGLKQLAPVGPHDEAIMDYTALAALSCGFDGIVLVVREEIREQMEHHVARRWPKSLPIAIVCQAPIPGTAQAVLSAGMELGGPFGVVNADDIYVEAALQLVHDHFTRPRADGSLDDAHVLVAYQLVRTVLNDATLKRGLCETGDDGELLRITEHTVSEYEDGQFVAVPLATPGRATSREPRLVPGSARVSMNLWGFHPRMLDHLAQALQSFDPGSDAGELLLPQVIEDLVASGADHVRVVNTDARCIGITHREDIAIVREQLAANAGEFAPVRGTQGA
ncbi:MAG TPA: sugar phosphate nucleotidyltransferase [Acidimicrobiales bacterium]|nr:sugar phosphate nucleotidyltransferase [Acidimicrobiales bacterium]